MSNLAITKNFSTNGEIGLRKDPKLCVLGLGGIVFVRFMRCVTVVYGIGLGNDVMCRPGIKGNSGIRWRR